MNKLFLLILVILFSCSSKNRLDSKFNRKPSSKDELLFSSSSQLNLILKKIYVGSYDASDFLKIKSLIDPYVKTQADFNVVKKLILNNTNPKKWSLLHLSVYSLQKSIDNGWKLDLKKNNSLFHNAFNALMSKQYLDQLDSFEKVYNHLMSNGIFTEFLRKFRVVYPFVDSNISNLVDLLFTKYSKLKSTDSLKALIIGKEYAFDWSGRHVGDPLYQRFRNDSIENIDKVVMSLIDNIDQLPNDTITNIINNILENNKLKKYFKKNKKFDQFIVKVLNRKDLVKVTSDSNELFEIKSIMWQRAKSSAYDYIKFNATTKDDFDLLVKFSVEFFSDYPDAGDIRNFDRMKKYPVAASKALQKIFKNPHNYPVEIHKEIMFQLGEKNGDKYFKKFMNQELLFEYMKYLLTIDDPVINANLSWYFDSTYIFKTEKEITKLFDYMIKVTSKKPDQKIVDRLLSGLSVRIVELIYDHPKLVLKYFNMFFSSPKSYSPIMQTYFVEAIGYSDEFKFAESLFKNNKNMNQYFSKIISQMEIFYLTDMAELYSNLIESSEIAKTRFHLAPLLYMYKISYSIEEESLDFSDKFDLNRLRNITKEALTSILENDVFPKESEMIKEMINNPEKIDLSNNLFKFLKSESSSGRSSNLCLDIVNKIIN